jgi:FG-GAP repeat
MRYTHLVFLSILSVSTYPTTPLIAHVPKAVFNNVGLDTGEHFGDSVATDGRLLLLGTNQGAAVLIDPSSQQFLAKFTLSDRRFEPSVAIDGTAAVVGNRSSGAFVYDFSNLSNIVTKPLVPQDGPHGLFGLSVDISGDTIIVGANGDDYAGSFTGSAFLFDRATGLQFSKLVANDGKSGDNFGISVAVSGNRAVVGSVRATNDQGHDHGGVYLFETSRTFVGNRQIVEYNASPISQSDRPSFGYNVDISGDSILALETFGTNLGPARSFLWSVAENPFVLPGYSATRVFRDGLSIDGEYAAVGDYESNRVYLYNTQRELLSVISPPDASDSLFGLSVAIGGDYLVVGSTRAAYLYSIQQLVVPEPTAGLQVLTALLTCFSSIRRPYISVR